MSSSKKSMGYVCCPVENRTSLLMEMLTKFFDFREGAWNKKVVVVFSHENSVRFHTELFKRLKQLPIMPVLKSDLVSKGGLDDYAAFQEAETGVLAVSSIVAQRLQDLSADCLVQYGPPLSTSAVRDLSAACDSYLVFLRPQETSFLDLLKSEMPDTEIEERYVPWQAVPKMPKSKIQFWYKTFHSMNINSKAAYKAYMDAIRDHVHEEHFNLDGVLIKEVAECYCLPIPPYYKLVKERPRHEIDLERKEAKAAEPLPPTAKVVKTKFKRVLRKDDSDHDAVNRRKLLLEKKRAQISAKKHRKIGNDQVVFGEDGLIELGRDSKLLTKGPSSKKKKFIEQRKADIKGLKKQLLNTTDGKKRGSKRAGCKRRRPVK